MIPKGSRVRFIDPPAGWGGLVGTVDGGTVANDLVAVAWDNGAAVVERVDHLEIVPTVPTERNVIGERRGE